MSIRCHGGASLPPDAMPSDRGVVAIVACLRYHGTDLPGACRETPVGTSPRSTSALHSAPAVIRSRAPHRTSWLVALVVLCVAGVAASCTGPQPTGRDGPTPPDGPRWEDGQRIERVYHVQLAMSDVKSDADRTVGRAMTWWDALPASERPAPLASAETLPLDVAWKAPLYRVRLGPFVSRERADAVLQSVRPTFPDAFVAPERVARR